MESKPSVFLQFIYGGFIALGFLLPVSTLIFTYWYRDSFSIALKQFEELGTGTIILGGILNAIPFILLVFCANHRRKKMGALGRTDVGLPRLLTAGLVTVLLILFIIFSETVWPSWHFLWALNPHSGSLIFILIIVIIAIFYW